MSIFPNHPDDNFKSFVYEHFSRVGKALSSPHRLILLNILCQGEHTVESLVKNTGLTVANVSRHLQMLKSVNLVKIRREGKYIYYSLADDDTCLFFMGFRKFVENHSSEVQAAMNLIADKPSRISIVQKEEVLKKLKAEETLIIDVRPREEFCNIHLPGALSIPLSQLEERMLEIPLDREIITYCRDNYCILADKAVNLLLDNAYDAKRMDIGILDWKHAGFPVVSGEEFS